LTARKKQSSSDIAWPPLLYDYRFSSREENAATGAWWTRRPEGIYFPATALRS
jgi:hypothetical protein